MMLFFFYLINCPLWGGGDSNKKTKEYKDLTSAAKGFIEEFDKKNLIVREENNLHFEIKEYFDHLMVIMNIFCLLSFVNQIFLHFFFFFF